MAGSVLVTIANVPRAAFGQENHWLAYGLVATAIGLMAAVYLWKRLRLRRERS